MESLNVYISSQTGNSGKPGTLRQAGTEVPNSVDTPTSVVASLFREEPIVNTDLKSVFKYGHSSTSFASLWQIPSMGG